MSDESQEFDAQLMRKEKRKMIVREFNWKRTLTYQAYAWLKDKWKSIEFHLYLKELQLREEKRRRMERQERFEDKVEG